MGLGKDDVAGGLCTWTFLRSERELELEAELWPLGALLLEYVVAERETVLLVALADVGADVEEDELEELSVRAAVKVSVKNCSSSPGPVLQTEHIICD